MFAKITPLVALAMVAGHATAQNCDATLDVDCTNRDPNGGGDCSITDSDQMSQSISASYSLSAAGGVEGIFEASATFGMDYTDEVSTSQQESYTVATGQKGYLSAFNTATEFTGTFAGCNQGDASQAGSTLALRTQGLTYLVVNTGN